MVQLALQVADQQEAAALAGELRGLVRTAISSPHGNYVIAKVIEVLPPPLASFVVDELMGFAGKMARHRFGCRIFCRLLEHHTMSHGANPQTCALVDELLDEAEELCRHTYAHHVIQSVLEHGLPKHHFRIMAALRGHLPGHARIATRAS